jgi:hypothetical protein
VGGREGGERRLAPGDVVVSPTLSQQLLRLASISSAERSSDVEVSAKQGWACG